MITLVLRAPYTLRQSPLHQVRMVLKLKEEDFVPFPRSVKA